VSTTKNKLTVGATVRIFRDGGVLVGPLLQVPDGRFSVRHLDPGSYVARDELGGEQAFVVGVDREDAVIVPGPDVEMGSGEPGSAWVVPALAQDEGTEPKYPKPATAAHAPKVEPQADVPVLGEPGSAKITLVPSSEPEAHRFAGEVGDQPARELEPVGARESLSQSPFEDEKHPAVEVQGKRSGDEASKVKGVGKLGTPPDVLSGEKESGRPKKSELPDLSDHPAEGETVETVVHAAAGPHAPMPDSSGDEPEDVPVLPAGDDDATKQPQGQVRDEKSTRPKRSSRKK
jgi:hypothetical protein